MPVHIMNSVGLNSTNIANSISIFKYDIDINRTYKE